MADATPTSAYYELWENRSGNLIAEFDTEYETLRFVRNMVQGDGLAAVLSWSLHRGDEAGPIAYGAALSGLVDKRMPV